MTKGPEMTTDNPDPLEVWNKAVDAYDERLFGIPSPVTRADRTAAHQAAAAIIAQHYATVIAENERFLGELGEAITRNQPEARRAAGLDQGAHGHRAGLDPAEAAGGVTAAAAHTSPGMVAKPR